MGPQGGQCSWTCPGMAAHGVFPVVGLSLVCYTDYNTFLFELSSLFTK